MSLVCVKVLLLPHEPGGELRLMRPKSVVKVSMNGGTFTHFPPWKLTTDRPLGCKANDC